MLNMLSTKLYGGLSAKGQGAGEDARTGAIPGRSMREPGHDLFRKVLRSSRGFTLIELMIVATIVGILAAIAVPNYQWGIIRAKEAVLREDLYNLRSTIDQFLADQGKYPDSLEELVSKKYLHDIPKDPFTKSKDTWVVKAPEPPAEGSTEVKGSVYNVFSGSDLLGTNNVPYNEW
jgi:general secretion pathway protein G